MLGVVLFPPVWVVAVLACALGAFVGADQRRADRAIQGARFRRDLGVMYVVRGAALLMTNGLTYNNLGRQAGTRQHRLRLARLQPSVRRRRSACVVLAVIAIMGGIDVEPHGFRPLALRLGRQRARRRIVRRAGEDGTGVRLRLVGRVRRSGGLILSSQLTSAGPTAGNSYELTAIAAVVIGGAALTGGRGNDPRDAARRLRHRLPVRRPGDHRHLFLLADSVHRRGHRARGAAQCRSVSPPRQAPKRDRWPTDFSASRGARPETPILSGEDRRSTGASPTKKGNPNV